MKNKILGVVAIIVVIAALLGVYYAFREQPTNPNLGINDDGSIVFEAKNVTIEVVDGTGKSTVYNVTTHADYLEGAMNDAEGLSYETDNGMVMSVNGERADYVLDGAYWAFYIGESYCNYGIADQPVNDGDEFRIEYTKA